MISHSVFDLGSEKGVDKDQKRGGGREREMEVALLTRYLRYWKPEGQDMYSFYLRFARPPYWTILPRLRDLEQCVFSSLSLLFEQWQWIVAIYGSIIQKKKKKKRHPSIHPSVRRWCICPLNANGGESLLFLDYP